MDLKLILRLMAYARVLRKVVADDHFDYSAVQAVSKWITNSLESASPTFSQISNDADSLQKVISLSTGLGMVEIWSRLTVQRSKVTGLAESERLENRVCNLKDVTNSHCLSSLIFRNLVILTLTQTSPFDRTYSS